MKPFRFQKFTVQQSAEVFRVGTDGVVLGALCSVAGADRILEIGTGTGLISLMLAQRCAAAKILAIDVNPTAAALAESNFDNSPFAGRLTSKAADFRTEIFDEKFDLIVCNPPFFEPNTSVKDVAARQKLLLTFDELIEKSARLVTREGLLSVIIPAFEADAFIEIAVVHGLYLHRRVNICGIDGGAVIRCLLEFSSEPAVAQYEDLTIEKSPRKFTDQYLELTREFHVFGS